MKHHGEPRTITLESFEPVNYTVGTFFRV